MKFKELEEYEQRLDEAQTEDDCNQLLDDLQNEPKKPRHTNYEETGFRPASEVYDLISELADECGITYEEAHSMVGGNTHDQLVEDMIDKHKELRNLVMKAEFKLAALELDRILL
ncbi:hypothetical protein E4P24_02750 [Haloferax sp. AS1]|uniref:hypothetical protein n=1 Tax=Haloferax sp. AS1 TaxID=2562277 RepID=UPI00165FD7BB|nr:hypothetical protein [Haloferax sp. AS1]MBC9985290.1 hypothetical protein [Haloferax sp. AS1]